MSERVGAGAAFRADGKGIAAGRHPDGRILPVGNLTAKRVAMRTGDLSCLLQPVQGRSFPKDVLAVSTLKQAWDAICLRE